METIAQPKRVAQVANGQQTHEPPLQLQHLREGESPSPRRQRTIADIAQPRVKARRINSKLKQGYVLRQTVLDRMVWTKRHDLNLETLSREMLSRKQTHLLRSTSRGEIRTNSPSRVMGLIQELTTKPRFAESFPNGDSLLGETEALRLILQESINLGLQRCGDLGGSSRPFSPSQIRSAGPQVLRAWTSAMASQQHIWKTLVARRQQKQVGPCVPGVHVADRAWHEKSGLGIPMASKKLLQPSLLVATLIPLIAQAVTTCIHCRSEACKNRHQMVEPF